MTRFKAALIGAACIGMMAPAAGHSQTKWPDDGGVSDFYTWSKPVPAKPGETPRTEPVTDKTPLGNASQSVRILYTSTDGVAGKGATYVSGELYLPKGKAPKGGWPLMAWAHGTVGIADNGAPVVGGPLATRYRLSELLVGPGLCGGRL